MIARKIPLAVQWKDWSGWSCWQELSNIFDWVGASPFVHEAKLFSWAGWISGIFILGCGFLSAIELVAILQSWVTTLIFGSVAELPLLSQGIVLLTCGSSGLLTKWQNSYFRRNLSKENCARQIKQARKTLFRTITIGIKAINSRRKILT